MSTETASIRFEGIGVGDEIWGGTQANFVVFRPGQHAKETCVILNDPAAAYLAGLLGEENTEEFRQRAARVIGHLWLEREVAAGRHIDSVHMVSRHTLEEAEEFVAALRPGMAAPAGARREDEHAHA
jgi:hypothetical protein